MAPTFLKGFQMSVTINGLVYTVDSVGANTSRYVSPAHTLSVRDQLDAKRQAPIASGNSLGVQRAAAKVTRDVVVNATSGEKRPLIVELSTTVPVGCTQAQAEAALDAVSDFGVLQAMKDLMWKGTTSF